MDFLLKKIEQILRYQKKWKKWQKVVASLACIVVFITTYALILPAITMDRDEAQSQGGIFWEDTQEAEETVASAGTQGADQDGVLSAEEANRAAESADENVKEQVGTDTAREENATEEVSLNAEAVERPAATFDEVAGNVTVHVEAPEGAFPAGTTMKVEPVADDQVMDAVQNAVENSVTRVSAVDIIFLDASGKEIEPAAEIKVSMSSTVMENVEQPVIVHVDEEGVGETVESEQVDGAVVFESDKFSVYVLVETEIVEEITLPGRDDVYEVHVTYGADAGIPENAKLIVKSLESDSDEYTEAKLAVVDAKKARDENFDESGLGFAALDISIVDETGGVIEPAEGTSVKVNIKMKELPDGAGIDDVSDTMEIQHLNNRDGLLLVETVANSENVAVVGETIEAEFVTDSFSTYTISWSKVNDDGLNGIRISRTSSGTQYIIYAIDATDGSYYALQHDGTAVKVASADGTRTFTGNQNNLKWYVIRYQNGSYDFYYGSSNSRRYLNAGTAGSRISVGNNDNTTWQQWSDYIFSAGNTFLQSYNSGTFRVRNISGEGDWGSHSLVYFSTGFTEPDIEEKSVTVHYGYMDGNTFVEFDSLPEGAQTTYGGPTQIGDQLNVRYEIEGKDYVTTMIKNPTTGTPISPLLQTEKASAAYWKYRKLTTNGDITEWQTFGTDENDIYVIYRDTPTQKSYEEPEGLSPEDLEAPATSKDVDSNNDGTYDISLSVTGKSNRSATRSHANVVVVLDTSSSMNGTDTGQSNKNRLDVAKDAIGYLADQLFAFNTTDDPNAIEVAFVNFSHRVRNEQRMNDIYSGTNPTAFKNMINGTSENGGTNYDTAIEAANSILWNDADPVYVVFVTDGDTVSRGYLEYDENGAHDHASDWDGGTYYTGDTATYGDSYLARARSAAKLQVNKILSNPENRFYSIGVFGNVQYLEAMGGTYLGQANERNKIETAFNTIISDIESNLRYEDVTIHDGITAMTSTALVNGTASNFRYSVTNKEGATTEYENGAALQAAYPGIGLASFENKQVTWNMGENYGLEDGVTYSVSFTVWPSQDAYDYLADFNNDVKDITAQEGTVKEQFFVQVGSDTYQYVAGKGWTTDIPVKDSSVFLSDADFQNAIKSASNVSYFIRTNTNASIDYTSVKYVEGKDPERTPVTGGEIRDPNGKMELDTNYMKVSKEFAHDINSANPFEKIKFYLKRDGEYYNKDGSTSAELDPEKVYTIELPKSGNWWDEIYIAPGLIEKQASKEPILPPLETGHDYTVEEDIIEGNEFEYEFTPQIVRPMVIGRTLTFLVKKDKYNTNTAGAKEYELENIGSEGTSTYYVASENDGSLIGTNRKTSELDITKVIPGVSVDESGQIKTSDPKYKESFTYRVKLSIPADGDPSGIMGYEYVPRLSDAVNNTTRVNIFGYQGEPGSSTFAPDTTRFKGRTYGAWNTQAYKYFVETYTEGTQTLVRRDENGDFIWLQDGDGINTAKKETIDGKDYYTITLDVTIKMDEVFRFNNLPSGTKYSIQEIYWNKYKADSGGGVRTIVSDAGNIEDSGYEISINKTAGDISTTTVSNDTVTGTIEELDTRYYNQFVNTLKGEPDIVQMKVTKHLVGYEWSGERYYFKLEPIDGAPMPPTINDQLYLSMTSGNEDRSYAFGYIRFSRPGTYKYKITELESVTADNVTYGPLEGVTGYGKEKIITFTVDNDLKVTSAVGEDTTFTGNTTNTTFTNIKAVLIKLLKVGDGDFNKPLDAVSFKLYKDEECTEQITKDSLGNDIGTNGVITTSGGGLADIGALVKGTYYLKETAPADGYNLLTELIPIEVRADGTVSYTQSGFANSSKGPDLVYRDAGSNYFYYSRIRGDETDVYADNSAYTFAGYRIVVSNTSGKELPHTGGSGTLPYTLSGIALIIASALMYGFRMRRRERRSF